MNEEDEQRSIIRVLTDLHTRFPTVDESVIENIVQDAYLEFAGAPVRDFIPVMVERIAKNRIAASLSDHSATL